MRQTPATADGPGLSALDRFFTPRAELVAALAAGALLAVGFALAKTAAPVLGAGLVWGSLLLGAVYGGRPAADAIAHRTVNIDVLMIVGAVFAAWLGHPEEGALLLFLFVLAGALEALAAERTRREITALHRLMPAGATVWHGGEWVECRPESLAPGERIRLGAGDLVPVDAIVTRGSTSMDQATLTGESVPRAVEPGDEIFAGTINAGSPVEARVLRAASQSSLQRILDLVTEAQQQREPVQRLIDRLSTPYAVGVFVVSAGAVLVLWLAFGLPLAGYGGAAYTAITFLIVASPCALVIATPTATLAAISRAARAGVLFKGGEAIERLAAIDSVCFDKTGTLTVGRPRLERLRVLGGADENGMLALAAALEEGSTHPLAGAVLAAAAERRLAAPEVGGLTNVAGRGVRGVVGGCEARLGSLRFVEELIPADGVGVVRSALEEVREGGRLATVLVRCSGERADVALLIMSDAVRPGAPELVGRLHALGVRPVRMLTGDNAQTAQRIAESLGLDRWDAELLPEDKVRVVNEMRAAGRRVGVIGDGVNDAPALSAAHVAIAIGSIGSDAALESADAVLLSDDLGDVPWAVALARRARGTIRTNLAIALGVIVGMGAATLAGPVAGFTVPLSVGVLAHEGGTVLVVLNSLRLLAARGAPRSGPPERRRRPSLPDLARGLDGAARGGKATRAAAFPAEKAGVV